MQLSRPAISGPLKGLARYDYKQLYRPVLLSVLYYYYLLYYN